jgi:Protein of unknown function, DUF481
MIRGNGFTDIETVVRLCGIAALVLGPLCAASAVAAPKTDIVLLSNGDRLTGEVKLLRQGKLTLKTDSAGTISIEWHKVAGLQTRQRLQVQLASGELYFGSAPQLASTGKLRVEQETDHETIELPLVEIVAINPLERGKLVERLKGYLTGGYTYTKSNDTQALTLSGGLNSTLERRRWSLDANTTVTTERGAQNSQWTQINGLYRWSLSGRWFWEAVVGAERNNELGLDLRAAVGAGFGRYLVQTGEQEWVAYAGLVPNRENPAGGPSKENLEALLGTRYAFFQYDTPERTVSAKFDVLPSLTDSGRVRSEASLESRYEIVKDFIFQVTVTGSYDNRPGPDAKSHTDYAVVTSLGFTF